MEEAAARRLVVRLFRRLGEQEKEEILCRGAVARVPANRLHPAGLIQSLPFLDRVSEVVIGE